jgi:hypothetical protein
VHELSTNTRSLLHLPAIAAAAIEFQEVAVYFEAKLLLKGLCKFTSHALVELDHVTTIVADQVMVTSFGADEARGGVAHVDRAEDAQFGEQFQGAVDRGPPQLRIELAGVLQYISRVEVRVFIVDHLEHGHARWCDLVPGFFQPFSQLLC